MAKLEQQHKDLGKLLMEEGLITEEQLATARAMQVGREKSIGRILENMGLITEQAKMAFLNRKLKYEIVDIQNVKIPPNILNRVSLSYAEKHFCVPLLVENNRLAVAMEDPTNLVVIDEIKAQTNMDVLPVVASQADIETAIRQYPRLTEAQADAVLKRAMEPLWLRILHPLLFLMVILAPLAAFGVAIITDDQFGNMVLRLGTLFDITLYLVLSWALWAIFVWEIDGLLFSPRQVTAG
jgi:hypothetical protein